MGHIASASQLQRPEFASVNGELRPYDGVTIHISAEALTRSLSIFEGLKAYWDDDRTKLGLRSPEDHYRRLCRSARLLHIPVHFTYEEYVTWCSALIAALGSPSADIWIRTTMYVVEGHWGDGTRADLVITGFKQRFEPSPPMKVGVSTWRRSSDLSLPARIKASANYQVARLARMEGNARGLDDMILLNDHGRVAEGTGACLLIVRDGTVITPPASEGALESMTVEILKRIAAEDGIPVEVRPIDRSELYIADEAGMAGTISELTPLEEIDGYAMNTNGIVKYLRDEYLKLMRQRRVIKGVDFAWVAADSLTSR